MESLTRKQQLLRQYVEHTLRGDDLAEFKRLAQTDLEFRREAELERRISQAIQQGQRERLRQTLDRFHAEMPAEEPQSGRVISFFGRPVPMQWAAAAAVVLVLGLGMLIQQLNKPSDTQLAQQPKDTLPKVVGQRVLIEQQETTPTYGLAGADSVQTSTTPVVLYTSPTDRPQYSFADDTLRLYGTFQPKALTLLIHRPDNARETYQLRANGVLYTLDRLATKPTPLRP